jgi:hypothetical protein
MASKRDARAIRKNVEAARATGSVVLLDSGNYESFWHGDSAWTKRQYYKVARELACDAIFTFDKSVRGVHETEVKRIVERANADRRALPNAFLIPIVHLEADDETRAISSLVKVARKLKTRVVAIAERELGDGILAKARFLSLAQKALRDSRQETRLHVLGTGNPLALLTYSVAGADTFDGLEWCRTIIDHDTGLLFHFQQYDFFRSQTVYGEQPLPFAIAGRAHNLTFMDGWIRVLREARKLGEHEARILSDYCARSKPSSVTPALQGILTTLANLGAANST